MNPKDTRVYDFKQIIPLNGKQIKDLTGQRFGRLAVLGYVGKTKWQKSVWLCQCDCGQQRSVLGSQLRNAETKSCGCLNSEYKTKFGRRNATHGMSKTPDYQTWCSMIARCENQNNPTYHQYGGRGITICDEWRHSFDNFIADVGPRPSVKYSIDRINVNGNYSCGHCGQCKRMGWIANCQWATDIEQANNTRQNHFLEFQGERLTVAQWAREAGIISGTLHNRLKSGWSIERALTTPPKVR